MSDASLNKVRSLAFGPKLVSRNAYFFVKDGIMYRAFEESDSKIVNQIVVPKEIRKEILKIAHDVPLGGHLGNRKTRRRILQNFFWPGIFKDVDCTADLVHNAKEVWQKVE